MQLNETFEIHHAIPSVCARLYAEGKVDISLCPIGALEDLPVHEIRGNYCIGADGSVETVVLFSKVPLEEIRSVRLDSHSRTSNKLLRILAERHWCQDWHFYFEEGPHLSESCLMIGDKVFDHKKDYPFQYDLAAAWKEMTGLPMVFAVWIVRPGIPDSIMETLDSACALGLDILQNGDSGLDEWQKKYLIEKISYPLDHPKIKAMRLFLEMAESLDLVQTQK